MPRRAFAYSIALSQVGPANDPAFAAAPASVRDEVKRWIVVYGLKEKDADLAAGLDRAGVPLAPIALSTRENRESAMGPADPNAPPLTPAYAVSRTRLLLRGEATRNGAQFFWDYDPRTGGSWGEVLDMHRKGIGKRGRRVRRNVIGISEAAVGRVRDQVMARWTAWKRQGLAANWRPDRPAPAVPPPRLRTFGRTDYENFTYGIGTSGRPVPGVQASGFFQRRPGEGLTAFGGPDRFRRPPGPALAAPRALAAPKPKPATPAAPPGYQDLRFKPEKGLQNHTTIVVDVAKIEAVYSRSRNFYVGPGGGGGIEGRYQEFTAFVERARAEDLAIEQPVLHTDRLGNLSFRNGRHRWAWLRDRGFTQIAVSVPRYLAKRFQELFGT